MWRISDLTDVIPKEQIRLSQETEGAVFGNCGKYTVVPRTEDEIASLLAYAQTNGLTVSVVGGGTKRGFGGVVEQADLSLSLAEMKGVVEHTPGDLTLTVKSGTTIQAINDYLSRDGQMIALDPRWPSHATIGGVIAANDSGPKRLRYGSARDVVIGLRVVYPDGRVIRTGGKVVKNVAGYDMNKLFVGSMGTLAVISEVTMKLRPLSPFESLVLLAFPDGVAKDIQSFVKRVLASHLEAYALELLSPDLSAALGGAYAYTLAVSFEDQEQAVRDQERWVANERPPSATLAILSGDEARKWWRDFADVAPGTHIKFERDVTVGLKIGSPSTEVVELVKKAHALGQEIGVTIKAHGGAGHGITRVYATSASTEALLHYVQSMRTFSEGKRGYAVVDHMPLELRKQFDVWGKKTVPTFLLKGIKQAVDPHGILNPTRFVGGL